MPYFNFDQDTEIHYEQLGSGTYPIVLLHGLGASLETWFDLLPYLSQFKLYLLDMRGFGLTSKPGDYNYGVHDHVPYVLAFMHHLATSSCYLIGHSYGGIVAMLASLEARKYQVQVKATVLIDSPIVPAELPIFVRALQVPVLRRFLVSWLPPSLQAFLILHLLGFSPSFASRSRIRRYAKYFALRGTQNALISTARSLKTDRYIKLNPPNDLSFENVLIIWGANDPIYPLSVGSRVSNLLPGSRFEIVPSCGHVPQEEQPRATAAIIDAFLREKGGHCELIPDNLL